MKTAKNDITGDSIQTKATSQAYADNYERIFGKKDRPRYQPTPYPPWADTKLDEGSCSSSTNNSQAH